MNKLYSNVRRNCSVPFEPICLVDDPSGLEGHIDLVYPPFSLPGFWNKIFLFSGVIPTGEVLYLDIDQVIAGDITQLVEVCRAAKQPLAGSIDGVQWIDANLNSSWLNSAWLYFHSPELLPLYEKFKADLPNCIDNPEIEQRFIWNQTHDLFSLEENIRAIKSFKFETV